MSKRLFGLLLLLVLALAPAATASGQDAPAADGVIHLQVASFDPLAQPDVAAADSSAATSPYYLVQFDGPVEVFWLEQVAALGGDVLGYVPSNTHVVRMAPDAVEAVRSLPGVRWVGPYRAAYKVAPELQELAVSAAAASAPVELSVIAFKGESLDALTGFLAAQGAAVTDAAETSIGPVVRAIAPVSVLPGLAQYPGISWIEQYIQPTTTNAEGRKIMGAESVWETFGYFGAGQIVAISDSGLSVQGNLSPDFSGRLIRAFAPSEMNLASPQCTAKTTFTDLNGHGTHVAGSVLGSGARSGSNAGQHAYTGSNAGVAPEAQLVFMALNTDGSSGIQCIDLNGDFLAKGYQQGARISSNSWGANTQGGYNLLSSLVDDYVWRNKDYLVLYSAGNSGPGEQTIGAPGTAKNVLTVGASENNRPALGSEADDPNTMASFSSRGPTADGRLKPDVVAPGTWVLSVRAAQAPDSSFWDNFNSDYAYMGGTSMATPLTGGAAAVVREWANKSRGILNPTAALLKAIMINGSTQLPGAGVASNNSGFGRVDLKNTLNANYAVMDDHVQGIVTNETVSYTVQVVASGQQGTLLSFAAASPGAVAATGAMRMTASAPVVAATAAITTPEGLRGVPLPGFDRAVQSGARIPDATSAGKAGLAPLPNSAPSIGGGQTLELPAATGSGFAPGGVQGAAVQSYQQPMVGGGDFEDPDWTDIWSEVWLGSGIPVRTGNPDFVISGEYSMWLGGTPLDDAIYYPVQFPETIAGDLPSEIAFDVRIIDQDLGFDTFCVALIDASGYFIGPYAPNSPECVDQNGAWSYSYAFSAADRQALAGQFGYLVLFTVGDGAEPHLSAFVDNIQLYLDFPDVTAAITPASGPPGTTFLLTGQYNVPYGDVDLYAGSITFDNYIGTVYADAAGDVAALLYTTNDIAAGFYPILTNNIAGRAAETGLTISSAAQPTLDVDPTSGPAGTRFTFTGSDFVPNDSTIEIAVNGEVLGSVGSDGSGAIAFTIDTATNTPAGGYEVEATDSAGRSAVVTFNVTSVAVGEPKLTVTPAAGAPGTTFVFAASNFTPSTAATAALDGQALGQVNIDATGRVTLTLETTSATAPGRYTLSLTQGAKSASAQYEVTAGGGAPVSGAGLYVTLVWTDPPAQTAAATTLVNDLDLFVDGPGGRVFANGGNAADRTNNVEAVRLETPAAGQYIITVRGQRVNGSFGSQPYALVATSRQSFGAGQDSVDLGQTNGGKLSGIVFADVDRDGVRDAGEPGLAGAQVVVSQVSGNLRRQATTNVSGAYEAVNLPSGAYTVTILPPVGFDLTSSATANVTIGAGTVTAPAIGAVTLVYLPALTR